MKFHELIRLRLLLLSLSVVFVLSCTIGFRIDPSETDLSQKNSISPPLKLSWRSQFDAGVADQPVVVGKTVLVPLLNGQLVALDLRDGKKRNRKRFGRATGGGLTVSNGVVYWSTGDEKRWVTAYDMTEGNTLWRVSVGPVESTALVSEGRLYVGSLNTHFFCLNASTGETVWDRREKTAITLSPVLDQHKVYYCDKDGGMYSRLGDDGTLAWQASLTGKPYSPPVISDGRIFVTTFEGTLLCLDTDDGRILWTQDFGAPIFSSVSADSSNVYVPVSSGEIYSLKQSDGETEWIYDSGTLINSRLRITGPYLILVTLRGEIVFVDKSEGRKTWSHSLDRRIVGPPVVARGHLIVADDRKGIRTYISSLHKEVQTY